MLGSILKFFVHESCGQCSPCRVGTRQLANLIEKIRKEQATESDLERMVSVSKTMVATSLCPLGQSLIMPVGSAVENFRQEFLGPGQASS
jgi:NADH:ubiquinone oxidoreductase subunit F (NADH-binding)